MGGVRRHSRQHPRPPGNLAGASIHRLDPEEPATVGSRRTTGPWFIDAKRCGGLHWRWGYGYLDSVAFVVGGAGYLDSFVQGSAGVCGAWLVVGRRWWALCDCGRAFLSASSVGGVLGASDAQAFRTVPSGVAVARKGSTWSSTCPRATRGDKARMTRSRTSCRLCLGEGLTWRVMGWGLL